MKIQIENYLIETTEHTNYNLIENKVGERENEDKVVGKILAYNISLDRAMNIILHKKLHSNPNILSYQQFLVEYRNEVDRLAKLLNIEQLK